MLDFFWPVSAKHDEVLQQQTSIMPAPAPNPPVMTQVPIPNALKRKRGSSISMSPSDEPSLPKKNTATMSHVEIPASDISRNATPASGKSDPWQQGWTKPVGPDESKAGVFHPFNADLNPAPPRPTSPKTLNTSNNSAASVSQQSRKITMSVATLRNTVESQFNLEILLKHRELRLVEQEIAKCQIALEQLRRCHVIPYPAHMNDCSSMKAVSDGLGKVYGNEAQHAPPWGVAEGPYTRHYEKWLLSSSAFDDNIVDEPQTAQTANKRLSERPTRGSVTDQGFPGAHPRSQRGSSGRLKALPHGYPEPKEEKGPMIVKRGSDGHMVKLVCLDCRRSNFNSVQGFINHCRIAHARQFASHDAAIEASGEEFDAETEVGPGPEINTSQSAASVGLVHPMIRSARPPTIDFGPSSSSLKHKKSFAISEQPSPNCTRPSSLSTPRSDLATKVSSPFKPSPQTPHLSALLLKIGEGGDLDELVTESKRKEDLASLSDSDDDDSADELDDPAPQSRSTRGVVSSGARPASSKMSLPVTETTPSMDQQASGFEAAHHLSFAAQTPTLHSTYDTSPGHGDQDNLMADVSTPYNLSPNTTDPHPAPSLVSDDDNDNTHSESEASSHTDVEEDGDHYMHHPGLLDHEDLELGGSSSISLQHPAKAHGPTAGGRSRPPTAIHDGDHHGERHVSFASPVRKPKKGSKAAVD